MGLRYSLSALSRPNRRSFLCTAGAGLLTPSAARPAQAQVIDTHIHLYDPTRPQGVPWPPKTDPLLYKPVLPGAFAATVRPLGITGAVVIEASAWVEDNQWILDLAKDNPIIVGLVGHLEPGVNGRVSGGVNGFRENLARFAANPLFRGIRLNGAAITEGIARPAFVQDVQRLADAGLMIDAIGNAAMVTALATLSDRVPKLRIAIDHMPGEPAGWHTSQTSRTALRELAKRPQVYCKVSGVLQRVDGKVAEDVSAYRAALDQLWEMFGADRVMYGSNWPVSDRLAAYRAVFQPVRQYVTAKGSEAATKFFAANSKRCYQWIDRS